MAQDDGEAEAPFLTKATADSDTLPAMRTLSFFLLLSLAFSPLSASTKPHTVTLGASRHVPYTPPEAAKGETATTLRIRALMVDGHLKEWTVGDMHEITDRTFVVRRALRVNDALPGEPSRWNWQPGPWISVDRSNGHVSALRLPDFDSHVSEVIWFRDYAAYCGLHVLSRSTTLTAMVWQVGARYPAASQKIGPWPPATPQDGNACGTSTWQRSPMRATLTPTGQQPITFDVVGTTSLIEEGDSSSE